MTYTVEELSDMSDEAFHGAVTTNMYEVSRKSSAFQSPEVIERTMGALIEWLWITNSRINQRAEDPNCPRELYENTLKYRSHLLAVIDITERRIAWGKSARYRDAQRWKNILHEVVDMILEGKPDSEILAIQIPYAGRGDHEGEEAIDLETWWEIRIAKDPTRVKPWLELERNQEAA